MTLALFTIAFNRPKLIAEQIRLLRKHLTDPFAHCIVDNSSSVAATTEIERICEENGIGYLRCADSEHRHPEALNFAFHHAVNEGLEIFGFLDHDIFPTRTTELTPLIEQSGFYGVGQRHAPTGHLYLWPGFCFLSAAWLAGREIDFNGIRGGEKANDGDAGSMMWPLFAEEDWHDLFKPAHGYRNLRAPDDYGLQSFGFETIGDWWHLTNGSHWMTVPGPDDRDALFYDLLSAL